MLLALLASKSIATYFQHARAATVDAQGSLSAIAARDINLTEGQQSSSVAYAMRTSSSGFLSSSSTQLRTSQDSTTAIGTSLGGNTVNLNAGRDINVRASSVIGETATTAIAGNNINLTAGQNTNAQTYSYEKKESGLLSGGGLGISIGRREQSNANNGQGSTAAASTVGTIKGNVNLVAGNQYKLVGSDIQTPNGDVNIIARQVDIVEARQTNATQSENRFRQSGLSISISNPVISAVQSAESLVSAASQAGSGRMQALGVAAAGLQGYNALTSATANPADITINVSLGSSRSQSNSASTADTARGSTVSAGNNVSIIATGGGTNSNVLVQGSAITAGNNALIVADNAITLQAATNQASSTSSNSSSSSSVGISYSVLTGTVGFNASASRGQGSGNGQDTSSTNSQITAGNTATLQSGGNTTLAGAVVAAGRIKADVGGNLSIQSRQDISSYTSQQSNAGGSVSFGGGGVTGGSISASKSNINSNFNSVNEQSGLKAGDGGFTVNVQGNTDLKGAVISSTQAAVDAAKNSFTTGGQTSITDLQNTASYKGTASGFTIGVGTELGKSGGGVGSTKGDAASTASAGISGIAGNTAVRTGDTNTGLTALFDAGKVQKDINAQVAITTGFTQQATRAGAQYAQDQLNKAAGLKELAKNAPDEKTRNELKAQAAVLENDWKDGGTMRVLMHAGIGLLGGGAGGAAGAAGSAVVTPQVSAMLEDANLPASVRQGLLIAVGAGIGSITGGTAGAAAGLTEITNNGLGTVVKRLGVPAVMTCLRNADCLALTGATGVAIAAQAAKIAQENPGLKEADAYLIAVTDYGSSILSGKPSTPLAPITSPYLPTQVQQQFGTPPLNNSVVA